MNEIKVNQSISNLENALARLEEALNVKGNDLVIDTTIHRFEFVIELYWKTLKRLLAFEGINANTPRETLKKAYAAKWIQNEVAWLQMLRDRNETSHVYDEDKAKKIYKHIRKNFPELKNTFKFLKDKFSEKLKEQII